MPRTIAERELTDPVALCLPDGSLNPAAVGWSRVPLHDTSGIDGRRSWGRNKRWEYWAVTTPTHIVALTVSSIDYAAVHAVLVHDRRSGATLDRAAIVPLGGGATLPASLGDGPARARAKGIAIDVEEVDGGTLLRGDVDGARFEITAQLPPGHERLGVVVPWSKRRFQYTVKDVARPAAGWLELDPPEHGDGGDGSVERIELPAGESWAVLDHGRGRWPYRMVWNWGAASGTVGGRTVGLQLGGKWTDGTGSTENAVLVDGRLSKIEEELDWEYDEHDWLRPWRIHGAAAELRFEPFWDRVSATELVVFGSHGHQCFGHYSGWVLAGGERVEVDRLLGWAEDVRNRW